MLYFLMLSNVNLGDQDKILYEDLDELTQTVFYLGLNDNAQASNSVVFDY